MTLSAAISQFRERGWVILPRIVDPADLDRAPCEHPDVLAVIRSVIDSPVCGEPVKRMSRVVIERATGRQLRVHASSGWHIDGGCRVSVIYCIDEFTLENGATQIFDICDSEKPIGDMGCNGHFVVGQHHTFGHEIDGSRAHVMVAPAGSAILFQGQICVHRAGPIVNDRERRTWIVPYDEQ